MRDAHSVAPVGGSPGLCGTVGHRRAELPPEDCPDLALERSA